MPLSYQSFKCQIFGHCSACATTQFRQKWSLLPKFFFRNRLFFLPGWSTFLQFCKVIGFPAEKCKHGLNRYFSSKLHLGPCTKYPFSAFFDPPPPLLQSPLFIHSDLNPSKKDIVLDFAPPPLYQYYIFSWSFFSSALNFRFFQTFVSPFTLLCPPINCQNCPKNCSHKLCSLTRQKVLLQWENQFSCTISMHVKWQYNLKTGQSHDVAPSLYCTAISIDSPHVVGKEGANEAIVRPYLCFWWREIHQALSKSGKCLV